MRKPSDFIIMSETESPVFEVPADYDIVEATAPYSSRRAFIGGAAALVGMAGLAPGALAQSRAMGSPTPQADNVRRPPVGAAARNLIRWDTETWPTQINPIGPTNSAPVIRLANLVQSTLIRPTNVIGTFTFDGSLARSFRVPRDGSFWQFALRPGVTWHNGSPFTAADVVATFEALLDRSYGSVWQRFFARISSVKAVDRLTVRFEMRDIDTWILYAFASCPIVAASQARDRDELARKPLGTGPFIITDVRSNDRILLARNPRYFKKGRPRVRGIHYFFTPDRTARVINLGNGTTALTADVPYNQIDVLKRRGVIIRTVKKTPNRLYYRLNSNKRDLSDVNLRQALALAIDRLQIARVAFAGFANPATSSFADGVLFYNPNIRLYGPRADLARARAALARAQIKPSRPLVLTIPPDQVYRDTATIIQASWQRIGISSEIDVVDVPTLVARQSNGTFDVTFTNSSGGAAAGASPTIPIDQYQSGSSANPQKYSDPATDRAIAEAKGSLTRAKIKAAAEYMQRVDVRECINVGLVYPDYIEAQGVPLKDYRLIRVGNRPFTLENARIG